MVTAPVRPAPDRDPARSHLDAVARARPNGYNGVLSARTLRDGSGTGLGHGMIVFDRRTRDPDPPITLPSAVASGNPRGNVISPLLDSSIW